MAAWRLPRYLNAVSFLEDGAPIGRVVVNRNAPEPERFVSANRGRAIELSVSSASVRSRSSRAAAKKKKKKKEYRKRKKSAKKEKTDKEPKVTLYIDNGKAKRHRRRNRKEMQYIHYRPITHVKQRYMTQNAKRRTQARDTSSTSKTEDRQGSPRAAESPRRTSMNKLASELWNDKSIRSESRTYGERNIADVWREWE